MVVLHTRFKYEYVGVAKVVNAAKNGGYNRCQGLISMLVRFQPLTLLIFI